MRPSDAFGRPRPLTTESEVTATTHANGHSDPMGGITAASNSIIGGSGVGGAGITTAPMMTYFLAEEADVDAALEAAGRDAESFKSAIQNVRHLRSKAADNPSQSTSKVSHPATAPTSKSVSASASVPTGPRSHGRVDGINSDDNHHDSSHTSQPLRPTTPGAANDQHQALLRERTQPHSTSTSHPPIPLSSIPPASSPIFSQSGTASLFSTPGPSSLSAMSSPSSRRNSLSSSFMMDDQFSNGGEGGNSRNASFDLERSVEISGTGSISFSPTISASGITSATADENPGDDHNEPGASRSSAAAVAAASLLLASSSVDLSTTNTDMMMDSGSAPQLIMPSIKMPSRRPFTEMGKSMGRLKVLIAGDSGVGKTSLIKAIVQSCQHIVHVDHITPPSFPLGASRRSSAATVLGSANVTDSGGQKKVRARRKSSRSTRSDLSTDQITEVYASTKPYPVWWNELSDAQGFRRRKSLGDNVLDRNIVFVDTPGYTGSLSIMDTITPVVGYVESYLQKLCSNTLSDADFVGLVSGAGSTSVDAVFYMISSNLKAADIEYLRLLTPLTNVIPLLARADSLRTDKDVAEAKERVARQLHEANIKPFIFSDPTKMQDFALTGTESSGLPHPYAVSSANGSDHDVMDASLLMSPDYVQPLFPTDLSTLVEQVFCQDGVSRLRHAAAQKLVLWRKSKFGDDDYISNNSPRPQSLYRPLGFGNVVDGRDYDMSTPTSPSPVGYGNIRSGVSIARIGAPSSFALARIADHTQREEHLAQIRLANWATELQRSLDNERARYEKLARNERAVWLTERLGECVQDGTLVAVPAAANAVNHQWHKQGQNRGAAERSLALSGKQQQSKTRKSKKRNFWSSTSNVSTSSSKLSLSTSFSHEDPLGLLEVTAGLRARGMFILELIGSLSVLSGMALWMAKHNYHLQVYQWVMGEWTRLWNGER